MSKAPRVMAVASAGGHWVQLMRLRPAWRGLEVTYVTTDPGLEQTLRASAAEHGDTVAQFICVQEANRWHKMRLIRQLLQLAWAVLRTRPNVVVTTGAAPGYFAIRLANLIGARTIWIDSVANAEELSLSGRQVMRHADHCLTQWEHLAQPDGPSYIGSSI